MIRYEKDFWKYWDELIKSSDIVIDRPKGSPHPKYDDFIYPLDYGYLEGTLSMDQGGIDIWCGSAEKKEINALIFTIDMHKKDAEAKILYACTKEEIDIVYSAMNDESMRGCLILREEVMSL